MGNSGKEKLLFAFKPIHPLNPPNIRTTVAFFGVQSVGGATSRLRRRRRRLAECAGQEEGRALGLQGNPLSGPHSPESHGPRSTGRRPRRSPFVCTSQIRPRPSSDPGTALPLPPGTWPRAWPHLRQLSKEKPPTGRS